MEFSDQSQFNRVRDALWQRTPSATVMVGAGFSRNAETTRPSANAAPSWRDLAEAMCERLYPQGEKGYREAALVASAETSGTLRLAQEFEVAFGRTDLHSFLQMHIRDDQLRPGELHQRLLKLPWRDVFTTNWDTLLERACCLIPERSYSILRNTDEIPLASNPRIVKLHGSIDGHFPLIFTEEDYRTYPDRFAPFVNTVQQSMMESIFCLLGFSGEDPNFLHWSGWVRDNLGTSSPKIYLAGWLGLSQHRRRMLESRNVIAIDLAGHPQAVQWPKALRHERATDWILRSLEFGRPYEVSDWPSPPRRPTPLVPDYLQPVQRVVGHEPKSEPMLEPRNDKTADGSLAGVRALLEVWRHNRKETYPGWLTAPTQVRSKMWSTREMAPAILNTLPELLPLERLNAVRELMWRWEIQLEPISPLEPTSSVLEKAAREVLDRIDCLGEKVDGEDAPDSDWSMVSEAWVVVGLALVTAARLRFDEEEFNKRLLAISPYQDENGDVDHYIRHERCLWATFSLGYASLGDQLNEWEVETGDSVWMMRKAALLFEIGEDEKAQELNTIALERSRQTSCGMENIGMLSREAWALFCSGATLEFDEFWYASIEWQHRWDKLTPIKCNTPLEMRHYAEAIKGESKPEKGKPFDLGYVRRGGYSFSQGEYLRWAAAYRAVRLPEVVGLPPTVRDRTVAAQNLELAARQLMPHEPELAARLVLRATQNESSGTLDVVLSRMHIAIMPVEVARRLARNCIDAIEYILPRIGGKHFGRHWPNRLAVIMEALSRFTLRIEADQVGDIFDKAIGWYKAIVLSKDILLAAPMWSLLSRSWESLPIELQRERIVEVLGAPIIGIDGFSPGAVGIYRYQDPCDLLGMHTTLEVSRTSENDNRWREIVGFVVRALRSKEEARTRAASRMSRLVELKILTADEMAEFGQALWGEEKGGLCDLPIGTNIFDWAFMVLPEPRTGLAEERFRAKWLNPEMLNGSDPPKAGKILWEVGAAIRNLAFHRICFSLSMEEKRHLVSVVERWIQESIPVPLLFSGGKPPIFAERADEDVRKAIDGLQHVLLEIDVSVESAKSLFEKWQRLNLSEMPARALSVGLIKALPERLEEVVQSLRMGLASDESKIAQNAANALELWLKAGIAKGENLPRPPIDLVQEVGVIISTRRKAALHRALVVAKWVVENGSVEQRIAIGVLVVQGLGYLAEELKYEIARDEGLDVPLLRWGCTNLAISMMQTDWRDEPAVVRWVENAGNDPLPEIRSIGGHDKLLGRRK